ncbi:hypothetical protein [Streptosporangium sp. KLBMP 9127]|nr:hypothetical protein [Streptosporangium sp. KLBMP 9127]
MRFSPRSAFVLSAAIAALALPLFAAGPASAKAGPYDDVQNVTQNQVCNQGSAQGAVPITVLPVNVLSPTQHICGQLAVNSDH